MAVAATAAMLLAPASSAQSTVFRCLDAGGRTAYQSQPCAGAQVQSEVRLPALPPAPANPRPSAWTAPAPLVRASITFYYDPAEEPAEYPTAMMEAAIQAAIRAWTAGCEVDLRYGGRAPHRSPGSPERVSIRWVPAYLRARHPAHPARGIAGTGSMADGIALTPRFAEGSLPFTLTHEMGHVLGLAHDHEDVKSVMSYQADAATRRSMQPSAGDYLACNLAARRRFGIDYTPPADAPARGPRVSDREFMERKYGTPR